MDKSLFKTGEFWQSGQRRAHTLHEISYRGCFKPELARFFIEKFTKPGDVVFDPFMGRGTTLLEAALLGRKAGGVDANPLGEMLIRPRLNPPKISDIEKRLTEIPWMASSPTKEDLLAFYHPQTLEKITRRRKTPKKGLNLVPFGTSDPFSVAFSVSDLTRRCEGDSANVCVGDHIHQSGVVFNHQHFLSGEDMIRGRNGISYIGCDIHRKRLKGNLMHQFYNLVSHTLKINVQRSRLIVKPQRLIIW
jgi:hypothetical protein